MPWLTQKRKTKVDEASVLLETASSYLQLSYDISAVDKTQLYSYYSIKLVMFVHGNKCVGRPVYKHFDEIKSAFMKEVVGIVGLEHAMSKGTELLWCTIDEPPTTPDAKASTS